MRHTKGICEAASGSWLSEYKLLRGPVDECAYVSRGGVKLAAGLAGFGLDVKGLVCADLGANVGGFTDCLLQHGAAKVYAVETGYGQLAWKLREDERVVVMERTNALHMWENEGVAKPQAAELVTVDLGWTRQKHAIAAALRWQPKHIVTLVKPQYETSPDPRDRGVLPASEADAVMQDVLGRMPSYGVTVREHLRSPIPGGAGKGRRGNIEYLAWVQPS